MKPKILVQIVLILTVTATFAPHALAAPIYYWGVYHQTPGEPPVGEASSEYLAKYGAFFHGPPQAGNAEKALFLTFDTGYDNGFTGKILDTLKETNVPAAFFLTGNCMKTNPGLVNRMASEGHIVGNHSMTHPDMSQKSAGDFAEELHKAEQAYKSVTGRELSKYYRPPEGTFSEANLDAANWLGYKTILWSVCYKDWVTENQPTPEKAMTTLIPRLHSGAIILLHSTSKTNAAILPGFIAKCRELGYVFKTLDEL